MSALCLDGLKMLLTAPLAFVRLGWTKKVKAIANTVLLHAK